MLSISQPSSFAAVDVDDLTSIRKLPSKPSYYGAKTEDKIEKSKGWKDQTLQWRSDLEEIGIFRDRSKTMT